VLGARVALTAALAATCLLAGHASASSEPYSPGATRSCLAKHGATLRGADDPSLPSTLTPTQRAETIVGTLADGSGPAFLYLAIAPTASKASAILKLLAPIMLPGPSASNSWSSTEANAAWTIVTLSGRPPGKSPRSLLTSCLTSGAAPTAPAAPSRFTAQAVWLCLSNGAAVFKGPQLAALAPKIYGAPIPKTLLPDTLFAETSTSVTAVDNGLAILVVLGSDNKQALARRKSLERDLGLKPEQAASLGSRQNVAWYASTHKGSTAAGVRRGKSLLLGCLD
jgi:hypothetical protein